jgi:hypothetical protein
LKGCRILEAQCRGSILATVIRNGDSGAVTCRLFRGPDGIPLAEYAISPDHYGVCLSSDGRLLARQVNRRIQVDRVIEGGHGFTFSTQSGGFHSQLKLVLVENCLFMCFGNTHVHSVLWGGELLATGYQRMDARHLLETGARGTKQEIPEIAKYDPERFTLGAKVTVSVVADYFGQVAILDGWKTVVCMFFAFRNRLAGWMPDGTRFGPASLTGGPETPGAMEKFGRALRRASQDGRKRS